MNKIDNKNYPLVEMTNEEARVNLMNVVNTINRKLTFGEFTDAELKVINEWAVMVETTTSHALRMKTDGWKRQEAEWELHKSECRDNYAMWVSKTNKADAIVEKTDSKSAHARVKHANEKRKFAAVELWLCKNDDGSFLTWDEKIKVNPRVGDCPKDIW